jgi:hypothetical protein
MGKRKTTIAQAGRMDTATIQMYSGLHFPVRFQTLQSQLSILDYSDENLG